jgi:translocation and assembly module TamB
MRTLSLTTAGQTWTLPAGQEAVLKGDATRLDLRGLTLTNGPQRVTVEGAYALKAEAATAADTVHVTAKDVQIADVDRLLLGTRNVKGLLQGDVTLTGTIDDPIADGTMTVTGGAVEGNAFESLHATARLERHDLTLDGTLVQSGTVQIKAAGHVPFGAGSLASTRPMDVAITSPPIDLGFAQLFTTAVTKVVGTGEVNLRLTGSPEAPIVDGTLKIAGGGFVLEGTGVSYRDVTGSLAFAANHLTIDSLSLLDDDGHELRATGQADVLGDAAKRAFNVRMTANKVHVLHNDMGTLQMVGDVLLTGDFEHPQISGHLRLDSGRLEVDTILQRTTNTAYSDTPQSGVITAAPPPLPGNPAAEPGAAAKPPAPPRKSGFDRVDLNLTVDVPDNLVMRGRGLRVGASTVGLGDMNVIAGGTIEVKKPAGSSLDVIGDVEVIRGTYTFQGRRFDVQRGSAVRFRGGSPADPTLDVSGDRDVGNVTATVHVHGTAKNPLVNLTSQPPLDEAEILSLVVFGQSLNDLGQGQRDSLAQTAGAMAAGTIANPLADSVARALDLDVFEILAPSQGGSVPVLSLGSTIGSRVYVGVKHEIGGDAAAVSFEYRFARFLRLVTSFAQGALQAHALERPEAAGIDLLFVFRY